MSSRISGDDLVLERLGELPADLPTLLHESEREGFQMLRRLVAEWETGVNRFLADGEALFAARLGVPGTERELVGIGGLSADPFASSPAVGRVRRVYVCSDCRRLGVGRRLVERIVEVARGQFETLRVFTGSSEGASFYEALGFQAISGDEQCTHFLVLQGS